MAMKSVESTRSLQWLNCFLRRLSLLTGIRARFVLLVRNLDVLARVYTMKTEIMQIKEEFGIQNNCEVAISVSADDDQRQKDQRVQKNSRHESDGDKKDSVAERTKNVICTCLGSRFQNLYKQSMAYKNSEEKAPLTTCVLW
ncbi:uncharacterized protein LOC106385801 isoform X2 [Brassica napus]|uniref:uncharacterized protein LOC106385801 isoform X2 n=1 Tax=Brassica napus TaxID=3708 RepID=UPI000BBE2063|nr:uncharacterized protein LOC106385801 isoform X2 [Brassica napus]XP_022555261.1 uncharacterized protein LOC106385801 isoform X2 [Brassica napus]